MKQLILAILLMATVNLYGQYGVKTTVNTALKPQITLKVTGLGNQSSINLLGTMNQYSASQLNDFIKLMANDADFFEGSEVKTETQFESDGIVIVFENLSKVDIQRMMLVKDQLYLKSRDVINFVLTDANEQLSITSDELAKSTLGQIEISKDDMDTYLGAFGGEYAYANNSFNWSYTPKAQSDINETELNAEFAFQRSYSLFSKDKGAGKQNAVFYAKGRVSTNENDSLNYLYIYPLNLDISGQGKAKIFAQFGVEGTQTFSSGRAVANFSYQKIINNLIDLSYGSNRLRLKPIINAGAKIYQEFDNIRIGEDSENVLSVQAFTNLYYNIPVFDIYTIILEANAFYDFNDSVNPNQDIGFNYSIALGVDVPKTPFKTLFKYKEGRVDVNNLDDSNLTIGLLADVESLLGKGK